METRNNFNDTENYMERGCYGRESEERYGNRSTHVHELIGSVKIEQNRCDCECHNHRFATVTGKAEHKQGIRGHVHKVEFNTDTYDGHHHEFCGYTGGAINVGCGRHIHLINDETEESRQHKHDFIAATLIENPIGEEK